MRQIWLSQNDFFIHTATNTSGFLEKFADNASTMPSAFNACRVTNGRRMRLTSRATKVVLKELSPLHMCLAHQRACTHFARD
jgi:menaquinone-dependent protoporphyrinogen IX oxidase